MSDGPQVAAFVSRQQRLCGVFEHEQVMALRDGHDGVHLAGKARVMHHGNGPGTWRDRRLDQAFVEVDRIAAHIDEHRYRAAQDKSVRSGHKGVRRHDHFVAGREVAQDGRHLERPGARVREQRALAAQPLFEPLVAEVGVVAVPGEMPARERVRDIGELGADGRWLIEWDLHGVGVPVSCAAPPAIASRRPETGYRCGSGRARWRVSTRAQNW